MFDFFRKFKSPTATPDYWAAYLAANAGKRDKRTPLEELRFVVFDTETTGLDVRKDRILSIGAVCVQHNQIDLSKGFECFVRQARVGTAESVTIHGILNHSVEAGIKEPTALEQFISYIGDAILVGQHVGFDVAILEAALQRYYPGLKLKNQTLDTAALAIRLEKQRNPYLVVNPTEYSLDALCSRLNISLSDRHTAAGDAYITAVLLVKLLSRLKARGVRTYWELMRQFPL